MDLAADLPREAETPRRSIYQKFSVWLSPLTMTV